MDRVLITGASGFLGNKLVEVFTRAEYEVLGTYFANPQPGYIPLDVRDLTAVQNVFDAFNPTAVVHTVALSDPDFCENFRQSAWNINYKGTANIARECGRAGARLDYLSTIYVFNGFKGKYAETDEPNPINWYGETKTGAEYEVKKLEEYAIYRFDKLYGYNGTGKPNGLLSTIMKGRPLEVSSDQISQPLWVDDLARAILNMQQRRKKGILHLAGPEAMSKYELTLALAKLVGRGKLVKPIETLPSIAPRPKNATLITGRARDLGIAFTPLKVALEEIEGRLRRDGIEGRYKGKERGA